MADNDLAEELSVGKMAPSRLRIIERIDAVEDGPYLMLRQQPCQVLEVATTSDRDRLEPRLAHEHGHEINGARSTRQAGDRVGLTWDDSDMVTLES